MLSESSRIFHLNYFLFVRRSPTCSEEVHIHCERETERQYHPSIVLPKKISSLSLATWEKCELSEAMQ